MLLCFMGSISPGCGHGRLVDESRSYLVLESAFLRVSRYAIKSAKSAGSSPLARPVGMTETSLRFRSSIWSLASRINLASES